MLLSKRRNAGMSSEAQRGFTLTEAITAVAVLGILSAIGVSYYDKQKLESHRSEAIIALTTLAQLQERYMDENGSYASSVAQLNPPASIVTAAGTTPQNLYQLNINNASSTVGNVNCNTLVNGVNHYYCYTITATAINGQAGPSGDTACTSLSLDQTGKESSTGTGTDCWAK